MSVNISTNQEVDFIKKDPRVSLTPDEFEHFDEGMSLKNESRPTGGIDFGKAVRAVSRTKELNILLGMD
jgi:hypothetical protein